MGERPMQVGVHTLTTLASTKHADEVRGISYGRPLRQCHALRIFPFPPFPLSSFPPFPDMPTPPQHSTPALPLTLLVSALLFAAPLQAQDLPLSIDMPLPGVESYSDDIPTPEEVIGHQIGTRHTEPAEIVDYFEAVAEASDRVVLERHGATYEGRPLIHAFVTSQANHGRLEAIREANVQLSEAPGEVTDSALATMPAVVYAGYSVHGNEATGSEAGVLLLYHLAAGNGPAVDSVLQNTVVILDPMFNPDGRNRFTAWANQNRGAVALADPQDREHNEPWPGGRTNHYLFDLNRDWLPAQHPESQGRLALFHQWRPQVLTDHHEMGSDATFFFQPGIPSRTNPLTPPRNQELTGDIGDYHAAALDQIGSLYYTQESYDDFYYGKGSTYPDVNGAVGILFEQASSRALERETENGVLTYAFGVRNQFATSLSTLEAVVAMREELLQNVQDFYQSAETFADSSDVKAYVVSLGEDRTRAQALAEVLRRHRIRLYELGQRFDEGSEAFEAGSAYVVPVDQPQARLVKAAMERVTEFPDSLFYDVSAWTLPLAFGVRAAELKQDLSPYLGSEISDVQLDGGEVVGGEAAYAYLMPWGRYFAPRALHKLQEAGLRPRLLTEPVSARVDGSPRRFQRGVVTIPVAGADVSPDSVHALVRQIAEDDHVRFFAAETGLTPSGPDLGGRSTVALEQPRIALLTGGGTSSYNAGEVWHLLSERFGIPVSLLDVRDVGSIDLSRYTALVMAGGYYGDLPVEKVKSWVQGGGHLVALTSAVGWAVENGLAELEAKDELKLDSLFQDLPYDDLDAARGAQYIGGSIFETRTDPTHPIAYGYGETVPVFRSGEAFYQTSEGAGTNVLTYTDDALLSGYLSEEQAEQVAGSAALVAQRSGQGRVTLFAFNPNFRAFWYGTNGLFLNALFFSEAY